MDRFDCQFLMATFVNVYISSFIRTASPQKLLAQVSTFVHIAIDISQCIALYLFIYNMFIYNVFIKIVFYN